MSDNKSIWVIGIVIVAFIFLTYNVYLFEGESLCDGLDCRITPGDIILTSKATKDSNLDIGDVLCTEDEICHILKEQNTQGFCTVGIHPLSLNKCYDWSELESKVEWVLPKTFLTFSALIIGFILIYQHKRCGI